MLNNLILNWQIKVQRKRLPIKAEFQPWEWATFYGLHAIPHSNTHTAHHFSFTNDTEWQVPNHQEPFSVTSSIA